MSVQATTIEPYLVSGAHWQRIVLSHDPQEALRYLRKVLAEKEFLSLGKAKVRKLEQWEYVLLQKLGENPIIGYDQ